MKTNLRAVALTAGLMAAAAAAPAAAHHSFSMFDVSKEAKVSGTIEEFKFTNPHTVTRLYGPDEDGKVQHWTFEGVNVSLLYRSGWRKDTLKPGDKVTIIYAPLKNGAHGGLFLRALLPGGYTLYNMAQLSGGPPRAQTGTPAPDMVADQQRTIEYLRVQKEKGLR